ncbi:uncharacterized protein LOC123549609 [Mercenaria mercenaria]|uniref:uncharacterized protein LOC123549609 n=1 Tax=Mercenaria mercenaria TaxID=6596 RepID=UPI00234E733B|nr:uncharacterized protein LOC123549609 [Mercenaria mercenaria]
MASDQPDIKPLQNGFPPLHLLSAVNSAVTSVATPVVAGTSAVPVSLIPVFQPNMFGQGLIGLPLTLNQQALFQASMDAAASQANPSAKLSTMEDDLKDSPHALGKEMNKSKQAVKRKYADALLQKAMGRSPVELADELTRVQPRTSKGKVYSWMYSAHPKRQRAKITESMKREIIEFCKNHSLLKQGEVADIFGVDRTTVTKMLKRTQEGEGQLYDPTRRSQAPQFELEDMLYRWISNATKHHPENQPVWSCVQLLEQAEELQTLTDTGNNFCPSMEWLLEFVERFRLRRLLTDFPADSRKMKTKSPGQRKLLPKPAVNVNQPTPQEDLTNAQLSNHKIPKERVAEYTIVETPLDIPMKIEPTEVRKEVNVEELTTEEAHSREIKQLDKFREQQKAIEEANKLKKDLLAKTLSERKQRAKKEAYKLEHIQKELSKLDHLLTADVNVVREKIEEASREFLEAQKRFQKAEVEYVESKVDLHNKSEIKEQLTEHLYTIIHQNEVRKAQKLADLMKELEMEYGDDVDLHLPELPPLTSFQQTNLHLSPSTGQTIIEHSKIKVAESSPSSDGGSPENCDKNSNTIVIEPCVQENASSDNTEGKSIETEKDGDSNVGNSVQKSDTVIPSFTIVEDGEPVSIVYDVGEDTEKSENNKDVKEESNESQNKATGAQKSETEQEKPENVAPHVKTKWDFDGSLS